MNLDNREEPVERYCAGCDRRDDDIAVLETALAEANRGIDTGIADLKFTERQLEEKNQRIADLEVYLSNPEYGLACLMTIVNEMKLDVESLTHTFSAVINNFVENFNKELAENKVLKQRNVELEKRFILPIVCICGSTRFKQAWIGENARLTQEGNIVLAVGLWGHHTRKNPPPELKQKLDEIHKRKIDLCDWVWVLNIEDYIGESTKSEIEYAKKRGKTVRYLLNEFPNYEEPNDEALQRITELENHINRLERRMKNFEKGDLVIHQANQMAIFADGYNMFREVLKNWLFSKDADENIVVSKKAVQKLIGEDEIKPISGDDSICSKCHRYGREKNEVLKQRITELETEIKKLKEE